MVPYLFISILSTWSSHGNWLLSVSAPAGLVQFPAGVCRSVRKLHPRGLGATRRTVADSRASPVKVRGGVFFNAPAQPMAQECLLTTNRGGSSNNQKATLGVVNFCCAACEN